MNAPTRTWLLAAAVLGCIAGLVAGADGAPPAPARARIVLEVPASPPKAAVFTATAQLVDAAGHPVEGAEITFYQATGFGPLSIKTVTTDERGRALLRLREGHLDRMILGVRFPGDIRYAPAQAEEEIAFRGARLTQPVPPARHSPAPSLTVKSVVFLVVGGVWVTYAYAVLLLVQLVRRPDG